MRSLDMLLHTFLKIDEIVNSELLNIIIIIMYFMACGRIIEFEF